MGSSRKERARITWISELIEEKYVRKELNWEKLARDLEVGQAYLKDVVKGRRKGSVGLLRRLALKLGGTEESAERIHKVLLLG